MAAMIATERRLRMGMPGRELVVQNVVNWRTSAATAGSGGEAQIGLVARADSRWAEENAS
jgi:hypothetical protein